MPKKSPPKPDPKYNRILTAYHPGGRAGDGTPFYTLHCWPSDSSGLSYEPGAGTVLTTPFKQEYEWRIYERDDAGYCGLCGQWAEDKFEDAVKALLEIADLTPANLLTHHRKAKP